MRCVSATWPPLGVSFSTCTICFNAVSRRPGRRIERAAEIMLVAESSCGFPIFGNGKSSRNCGCTDSSRASFSCSNTRCSRSRDVCSFQDAGRLYSPGVTGASRPRRRGVECTCSRSRRCIAAVEPSAAAQLSVVTAGLEGGGSGSERWMTSVADEGHLDPPAETSQRRSCQELWCLCKQFLSVFTSWELVPFMCLCMCVWCSHYLISPSTS